MPSRKSKVKRKDKISPALKRKVWRKLHPNKLDAPCWCITNIISADNFICSHIRSEYYGGTIHINNLIPTCNQCSQSMGTENAYDYYKKLQSKGLDIPDLDIIKPPPPPSLSIPSSVILDKIACLSVDKMRIDIMISELAIYIINFI